MSRRRSALAALCVITSTPSFAAMPPAAAKPIICEGKSPVVAVAHKDEPKTREAAQRGLEYLVRGATQWTQEHSCFGCHVQAVTLEGLSVGKHNQYDIAPKDIDAMVNAMLLGVTAGGHKTGTAFQGSAWARYDQLLDAKRTDQLLKYGRELVTFQQPDGSVADDDLRKPVVAGTMQITFQAMQTWRQAFARTADDQWLTPMRKAERYLSSVSSHWTTKDDVYLQDVNYALMGLTAAGAGSGEASSMALQKQLLSRQNHDGGWGLVRTASDAIATGQTLYALKLAGLSDQDPVISRGMGWLIEHQQHDGRWTEQSSQGGADKGATMWAVLGLVTVDVVSVAVDGVRDGQHVTPTMTIEVNAKDNQSGGLSKVEIFVDDQLVQTACGSKLSYAWKTQSLSEGKHLVDAVATSLKGKQSRRRFEVYAGNVYLTQLGTHFDEVQGTTEISLRDIAPPELAGKVALEIYAVDDRDGSPKTGKKVFSTEQQGTSGGMGFNWDGKGADGKMLPKGRYQAQLVIRDAKGAALQKEETFFFQDSERVQKAKFAEVEGQLSLQGGAAQSANTTVELVDEKGRVVQSTRTTEQGNYRFKNVDQGKYKVRARKDGFGELQQDVNAAPASAPARANMTF